MHSINNLKLLPRNLKRLITVSSDMILLPFALWSAIALRYATWWPSVHNLFWLFVLTPCITIPILAKLGLYRAVIRYLEDKVIYTVILGVTLSVCVLLAAIHLTHLQGIPRSSIIIYWVLATLYITSSRFLARSYFSNFQLTDQRKRIAIYGASPEGVQIGMALRAGSEFLPIAFFDDRKSVVGHEMAGIRVFAADKMAEIIQRLEISQVLLAMPSASHARHQQVIAQLEPLKVIIKTIPTISDVINGEAKVADIREVQIEDLLGRDAVVPDPALMAARIKGRIVMVTGAGGSIGSELCRQILALAPRKLILFEQSEYALYRIEKELTVQAEKSGQSISTVPILGSVVDRQRVEAVMRNFGVQTVYHAAAYKHVPLVEYNIIEGVRNNVFGTLHTAEAAVAAGVETFVLISTDKAVRPTNAMGASKRVSELILQALARQSKVTCFSMVRFGNVLGSSGSVVPLFKEQIQKGGPITLTHPDITRYFMTIPEAAQLVLQASAIAKGGDVCVLDMGKPIKILDLARRMVHLSGLEIRDENHPDGNIEIRITGLRPGEKLYEELLIGDNVTGTDHPLIMKAQEIEQPWTRLKKFLDDLDRFCNAFDCQAVRDQLQECVAGFTPQNEIEDFVWRAGAQSVENRKLTGAVLH